MHRSYGLQGSLKRRYKHPSPTSINGYHTAKKLLSQSPAKRPTFAFADESGYTLAFANRIAHSGLHAETGAVSDGGAITTLRAFRTFTNIPGPGIRKVYFAAFGLWPRVLPKNAESLRSSDALMRVAVPRRRGPAGLRDLFRFCRNCGLYTLGSPRKIAHKGTHAEIGGVLGGGAIITLDTSCTFTNIPGPGVRTANFAAFGSWSGVLPKNAESLGTAMRLCASLFQGVAAPLGCVIFFRFCRNYGFHTLCSRLSACARHRRYHYPRRALRASETLDSRLSKRLSCYSFRPS